MLTPLGESFPVRERSAPEGLVWLVTREVLFYGPELMGLRIRIVPAAYAFRVDSEAIVAIVPDEGKQGSPQPSED